MKRIKFIIICSLVLCSFFSCGIKDMIDYRLSLLNRETTERKEFMDNFFNYLKDGKSSEFMSLFSENTKNNTVDFQGKIDYIFDEFKNDFKYDYLGTYSSKDTSLEYNLFCSEYKITHNNEEYWFRVIVYTENTDKNEVGIKQLLLCDFENKDELETKMRDEYTWDITGIFIENTKTQQ